jgi:outer membrane receptor protein involved in Fe transport
MGPTNRDGLAPYHTFIIEAPGNLAYDGGLDDDGQLVDFYTYPEHGYANQESVEAQLNGKFGALHFVTGLFYFAENGANIQFPVTFAASPDGYFEQDQRAESEAVYGNVGYEITPALRLSAGVRYTRDNQSGGYPARPYGGADTFKPHNPVIATDYEVGIKGEPFPGWQSISFAIERVAEPLVPVSEDTSRVLSLNSYEAIGNTANPPCRTTGSCRSSWRALSARFWLRNAWQ